MKHWQLQTAKAKLSELVKRAQSEGPQAVTMRGERAAVVVSAQEYDKLTKPIRSLLEVLTSGPSWDEQMHRDVEFRDRAPPRDIKL